MLEASVEEDRYTRRGGGVDAEQPGMDWWDSDKLGT